MNAAGRNRARKVRSAAPAIRTLAGRRFLLLPAESEDELSCGVGVLVSPVAAAQSRFSRLRNAPHPD
jgi:hypothetical protein